MKQWWILWIVAIGISAILTSLTGCNSGKNIPSVDLPIGEVVRTEFVNETITTYTILVATSYGLERTEVDFDMYSYINVGDSIVLPQ